MALQRVVHGVGVWLIVAACAPSAAGPPARAPTGPAAPPAGSVPAAERAAPGDTLAGLIAAARAEGQLNLMWTPSIGGRTRVIDRWQEGFNTLYGLNVKFQYTPGPTIPEMLVRLTQEVQAGRPASSDVYLGSHTQFAEAFHSGVLQPVDWLAWAPHVQDPALLAPRGIGVEFVTRTPGITYNTNKVRGDEVPTSFADLLKPQYKGRIAAPVFGGSTFEVLASSELWGEQRTVEYVTRFAEQTAGLIRCAEAERIASGEFDFLAPDCGTFISRTWQARGAPMAAVIPTDAALLGYLYFGVPTNSAHPAAAKLFVNYVLTREAQDILYEAEKLDHHLVPGSHVAPEIERLQAQGVRFAEIDVDWLLRQGEHAAGQPKPDFDKFLARQ